jgi:hypothetical protein
MTPQERAEDLVIKYSEILPTRNYIVDIRDIDTSKKCALIAVDEIINANPTGEYGDPFIGNHTYDNKDYWAAVKQEIEKL